MPRRPVVVLVVVLVAALAGVTGCADPTTPTTTTTTTTTTTATTTPEASSPAAGAPATPPPAFGRGPSARRPSGAYDLVLREVTVHEVGRGSADRVVLRLRGTGRPGWSARYVDRAVLEGSGDVVQLAGDTVLRIDVSGTPTRPAGTGRPPRLAAPRGDVADLRAFGAVEGITQVFVGLAGGRAPFRVVARTDPARLVVDVR